MRSLGSSRAHSSQFESSNVRVDRPEREHRRGLVLGLTLAEILILLLFLLLLALGTRLEQMGRQLGAARSERDHYKNEPDRHRAAAEQTAKENADLKQQNEKLKQEMAEVRVVLGTVRKIDPNEPPAVLLKRIERVIAAMRPEDLKTVSQTAAGDKLMVTIVTSTQNEKLKKELDEARAVLESARKIDPNEPPAALLKRIERVIAAMRPQDLKAVSQMSASDKLTVTIVTSGKDSNEGKTGTKADDEHNWPPIITLSDASGYFFRAGSADPSPEFRSKLTGSIVDQILKTMREYKVDVIEVIGHTDEQPVYTRPPPQPESPSPFGFPPFSQATPAVQRYPNLDATLIPFLNSQEALDNVLAFDNAGLGLARAAAVARILLQEDRLRQYRILPLSAGQLIQGGEILSTGAPGYARHRRRIEI